jgi:autotransporter-associated beta strand protein
MTGGSTFDPQANATLTLGVVHGGANGITKTGAGTLVLSGASTHTGDTTVASGVLQINNNNGAGNGAISILSGAPAANRVLVNGGVTIFNPISFGATVGTAGFGVVQQTGTGQATVNGPLTITGGPSAGGHFVGGTAVGNELVIGGPINSTVSLSHRAGRIIYRGGGSVTAANPTLTVTDVALIGATNGLPTNLSVFLGGSQSATLDLNGFDQALRGLTLGNAGQNYIATVNLGARVLTLNGDVVTQTPGGVAASHTINATAGGTLALGSTLRTFNVSDTLAADDLALTGVALTGTGGVLKDGAGTISMRNTTVAGPLTINAGTLQTGTSLLGGSLATGSLHFNDNPSALAMKLGTGGDIINTNTLTTGSTGSTVVNLSQVGGALPVGNVPLINYTGASPGVSGFTLGLLPGRVSGVLVDTGTSIALNVTANDEVIWDGTNGPAWATGLTGNWKLLSNAAPTDYFEGDVVTFPNGPMSTLVDIGANVSPAHVQFTNTLLGATDYTITGLGGISGPTSVVKTGDGKVTISNANSYAGATTVSAGTLELDHDATGNVVLTGTSGLNVGGAGTLRLTRDDGGFTFNRNISGTGVVAINPHSLVGSATAHGVTLSGNNAGFTGLLQLESPQSGTYRLTSVQASALGGAAIEVQNGAQVYTAANQTYTNAITITGTGFADANGNIGALRLEGGSNWAGPVSVNGTARIGAHNSTGTVSGDITGGDLEVNATNYNNGYTVIFTGSNSYGSTTIGGQNIQTAGVPSMRLNIGNGGTTGTLGSDPVTIHGDGANGVLGFDRSDGYTLLPGQTITASNGAGTIANSIARTFIDFDTLGAGFNDNGNTITLGSASIAAGGQFRVGQARANAVASFTGTLTGGTFRIGSGQGNATANLNAGANANFERVHVGIGGVTSTSMLNLNTGATLSADYMTAGEVANHSGIITQAVGTTVNVVNQLRLGHFPTETSTYNMNGGTLTLTGASPINTPSTAGAGAAGSTGDNNINATNPATIVGGGIYLGIDGTGIFNHNGGTVTTNWIVLDNRGDTITSLDGIDRYTINGAGAVLAIRSTYGLIQRNASSVVSFGDGTVRVDNTGTGTGTGADITIPLDATIGTLTGTTTTLDTNGAGNGFTLNRDVRGTGTLALAGGGTINLTTAGHQNVSANLSGATNLNKIGTGITTLTGNAAAYSGTVSVSVGGLNLPASLATAVTVADGAAIGGEPVGLTSLTLGSVTGSTLFFDPNTAGAITAGTLTVGGTNLLDLTALPLGAGPYTAINYTTKLGAGTFSAANPGSFRVPPVVVDTGSSITLDITGRKNLTWTGNGGTTWTVGGAVTNWDDTTPAPDLFFTLDTVTFPEGGAPGVTLSGLLAPAGILVDATSTAYTLTSTPGNQIVGATGLTKTNGGSLALVGDNPYSGPTDIAGGTLSITTTNSIGNATPSNTIGLSNGGRLSYAGSTALDLTANRSIAVGVGGGSISHNNATAATITIPGNITGTEPLSFHSNAAGAGTFVLTGNNSGYSGDITVDAPSVGTGGLTVLRIANAAAIPAGGSITLNYPAAGATGNATTLDLSGITLPASITINMTSFLNGATSLRSQITSTAASVINGPINLSGSSIIQITPTGSVTVNGPINDAGFTGTLFLRNTGTVTINNTITLPSATVSHTDPGLGIINSTGNSWAATSVVVGTLRMGVAGALPAGATLLLGQNDGNTATLDLNGFNQTAASLTSNPAVPNANSIGKSITTALPATLTIDQGANTSYASLLTGELSLEKTGVGRLTLLGANTYNGVTTVTDGVLAIQHRTALGSTLGGTVVANGGTLEVQGNLNVGAEALTLNGAGFLGTGALLSVAGNNIYGGPITIATSATIAAASGSVLNIAGGISKPGTTVTFTGGGSININSMPVTGAPAGSDLIIDGVGLTMNVASTYNGPTVIRGGGLLVNGVDQAVPAGSEVTLGDGATNSDGTWLVNGTTQTIAGLASDGSGAKSVAIAAGALTVNQAADTVYDGSITGTGILEKAGAGTLALTGIVDVSTVTVNDGTLNLHVAAGTGTSTINANDAVNLGTDQTLAALNIGASGVVTVGALPPPSPGEPLAAFAAPAVENVAPVPEPGAAALLLTGFAMFLRRRRR